MRHGIMAAAAIGLALPQAAVAERHQTSAGEVEVTREVDGLDTPWAVGFLPDGEILITERDGRLLLVRDGAKREVAGVPEVRARGQGGLLDVVPARDFAESGEIFLTYAEPREGGAATALAVARLDQGAAELGDLRVIFRQADPTGARPALRQPGGGGGRRHALPDARRARRAGPVAGALQPQGQGGAHRPRRVGARGQSLRRGRRGRGRRFGATATATRRGRRSARTGSSGRWSMGRGGATR